MSVPTKFTGGVLIRRDPNRMPGSAYQEDPYIRLIDPLDLYVSAGAVTLVQRAASLVLGSPDTQWVEVAVREHEGNRYILIAPTTEDNPLRERLVYRGRGGAALIRTADDVLMSGGIAAVPGAVYRMDAVLVEDEQYQWVVAASWTKAVIEDQGTRPTALDGAAPATPVSEV